MVMQMRKSPRKLQQNPKSLAAPKAKQKQKQKAKQRPKKGLRSPSLTMSLIRTSRHQRSGQSVPDLMRVLDPRTFGKPSAAAIARKSVCRKKMVRSKKRCGRRLRRRPNPDRSRDPCRKILMTQPRSSRMIIMISGSIGFVGVPMCAGSCWRGCSRRC